MAYNISNGFITTGQALFGDPGGSLTLTGTSSFSVQSGTTIDKIKLIGQDAITTFNFSGSVTGNIVRDVAVTTSFASPNTGTCFNLNTVFTGVRVIDCSASGKGYGFIANTSSGGGSGLYFFGYVGYSDQSDALALNWPGIAGKNTLICGASLSAGTAGSGTSSGFALSMAHAHGFAAVGLMGLQSRLEAVHIEDGSRDGGLAGGSFVECGRDGIRVLGNGAGSHVAEATPLYFAGLAFAGKTASYAGSIGVYPVWDASGTSDLHQWAGVVARNFEIGVAIEGQNALHAINATVTEIDAAARVINDGGPTYNVGTILSGGADALVREGSTTTRGGNVHSVYQKDAPVHLIQRVTANKPGLVLENFLIPKVAANLVAATPQWVTLFPAPTRMVADHLRVTVITANAANGTFWDGHVHFDGTTVTTTQVITDSGSAVIDVTTPIRENGGNIQIQMVSASTVSVDISGIFHGVYYK